MKRCCYSHLLACRQFVICKFSVTASATLPAEQNSATAANGVRDLNAAMEDQQREINTRALEETRWNRTAAAKKLGITFRALRYRLKKLGLE